MATVTLEKSVSNPSFNKPWPMPRMDPKSVLCVPCIAGVDDLGWDDGITFECYGARIGVRFNDDSMRERVLAALPPYSKPARSGLVEYLYSLRDGDLAPQAANSRIKRFHLLYLNTLRMMRTREMEKAWEHLESSLHFNVAVAARKKIFVHAGVVAWKGRAILIPGRTKTGKTSLVAALVRAGAQYYSDEYAVIDEKGRVHPYAKALSVRDENGVGQKIKAVSLGGEIGEKPLPVGLVVATEWKEGARWRPRKATPGQGIFDLLDNTILAQERPAESLAYLNAALQDAFILKGKRGQADELAGILLQECNKLW